MYAELEIAKLEIEALHFIKYSVGQNASNKAQFIQAINLLTSARESALGQTYNQYAPVMFDLEFDREIAKTQAVYDYIKTSKELDEYRTTTKPTNPSGWVAYIQSTMASAIKKQLKDDESQNDDFKFDSKIYQAIDTAESYINYTAATLQAFVFGTRQDIHSSHRQSDDGYKKAHDEVYRLLRDNHEDAWRNLLLFATLVEDDATRKRLSAKAAKYFLGDEQLRLDYYLSTMGNKTNAAYDSDELKQEVAKSIDRLDA